MLLLNSFFSPLVNFVITHVLGQCLTQSSCLINISGREERREGEERKGQNMNLSDKLFPPVVDLRA